MVGNPQIQKSNLASVLVSGWHFSIKEGRETV